LFIPLFIVLSFLLLPLFFGGLFACCFVEKGRYKVLATCAGIAAGALYAVPYLTAFKLEGLLRSHFVIFCHATAHVVVQAC
jgi:hypothetical protein